MKPARYGAPVRFTWPAIAACVCAAIALQLPPGGDPLQGVALATVPATRKTFSVAAPLPRSRRTGSVADTPNPRGPRS